MFVSCPYSTSKRKGILMKVNFKNIKQKRREITLITIIIMVIILFFSGYSLGKGLSKTNIEAKAKIAEPILIVENSQPVTITTTKNKGLYNFKIKNYNETGKISDISLNYTIEILSDIEGVDYKLYRNDKEIAIENKKTEKFILTNQEIQEDLYRLEIVYSPETTTTDIFENIQIKVHTEQQKV